MSGTDWNLETRRHQEIYEGFMSFTKWTMGGIILLLALMAIFLL